MSRIWTSLRGTQRVRRAATATALLAVACMVPGVVGPAGPAGAYTTLPLNYTVDASTTLATLHQTVNVPPGTFTGTVDLTDGSLRGHLALPPAATTVSLAGIGLVTATFDLVPVGRVTGTVDIATLSVTASATFDVRVVAVDPLGLPVNLVGDRCETTKAVTVPFSGAFSLTGDSSFSGEYTIPPLHDCGLATAALNLVVPGPGNTFTAAFSPAS